MTSTATLRTVALPAVAAALVGTVLGVQIANGGGDFAPVRPAPPCAHRVVTSVSTGIEGLAEQLALLGLDGAACRLHVTREALVLDLARSRTPTDAQVDALRAGLIDAVNRLKADGRLPPAAKLTDEALDSADLNGFVKAAIRALPDSLINAVLKTDDVLRRTINELDLRALLTNLDDPDQLSQQVDAAVTRAVKDSLVARLRDLI